MALFKILKGTVTNFNKVDANGNPNVPIREGYCYVTTDEKHMYIDISSDERICLEAEWADHARMLGNQTLGSSTSPIYLSTNGVPAQCERLLPLSAGVNNKLTGALGLPKTTMYGPTLPSSGFDGQLFFLEDSGATLPVGGSSGQALIKNSSTDGDASWKSSTISWTAGTTAGPKPNIFGVAGSAIPTASGSASGIVTTGSQTFAGSKTFNSTTYHKDNIYLVETGLTKGTNPTEATYSSIMVLDSSSSTSTAHRQSMIQASVSTSGLSAIRMYAYQWATDATANSYIYVQEAADGTGKAGSSAPFYGAVWNDYAEFRSQKESIEPGYCVASANNGKVYKTTEKFQACDGIVSDTFGFSIGETDECQTPLAVAGRVLAYFHGNREDYHAGDTVCAGPEGKVIKMTREEICEWPDRIVGIVSEIPDYKIWGSGNIEVNNRIWIKVK